MNNLLNVNVKSISKESISVLNKVYYTEEYTKEMMRREYVRGLKEGREKPVIHLAQIESCSNCANNK